jgi:hypothetical protein
MDDLKLTNRKAGSVYVVEGQGIITDSTAFTLRGHLRDLVAVGQRNLVLKLERIVVDEAGVQILTALTFQLQRQPKLGKPGKLVIVNQNSQNLDSLQFAIQGGARLNLEEDETAAIRSFQ